MELKTNTQSADKTFLTILSDGKFHQRVDENTEGAVAREYEKDVNDAKGKKIGTEKVTVHDLVFSEATGMITNMYFLKGQFGENLIVEIDNDGAISFNGSQSYGEQLLRKLPNIDLSKPVTLAPYNFAKNGKSNKGVTVIQDGEKLQDYYFDYENKVGQNGLPEFDGDAKDSNDWKLYFLQVNKFLKKQVQPIFEANGFKAPEVKEDVPTTTKAVKTDEGEVDESDIDF